jgi:glycosyltransferase involved in cell wall biosynthesis
MRNRHPKNLRRLCRVLAEADAITVLSQFLRERAIRLGAVPEKVHAIFVGIDLDKFPSVETVLRQREARSNGPLRILSVARLVPVKAPEELPRLAGLLKDGSSVSRLS